MDELREAFEYLQNTLQKNLMSSEKNFLKTYFAWWRFFYCFNENLEHTERLVDKIAMIDSFIAYNKQLTEIEAEVLAKNKLSKDKLPPIESFPFSPEVRNLQLLLKQEQGKAMKLVRQVKREKEGGKEPSHMRGKKKNRLKA